jgi:hypothetical protein
VYASDRVVYCLKAALATDHYPYYYLEGCHKVLSTDNLG